MLLSMANNLSSFLNWLRQVMKDKDVLPVDIARTGFVTESAVSLLMKMTTKSVSIEMCKAISVATGVPLITVYRKAGYLPPDPLEDEWVLEMDHKIKLLPAQLRSVISGVVDSMLSGEEAEKQKQKSSSNKVV